MDSLFDKLSTLVNAQLNDFLGKNPKSPLARIRLDAEDVENNPRRTVKSIRDRLEEAMAYEDEIQAKIDKLTQEVIQLDEQVDAMIKANDEFGSRRVQGQLNMKQQQLSIAESELRDHRTLTQHLMQEMTSLEMALDNQQRQPKQPASTPSSTKSGGGVRIPIDGAEDNSSQENTVIDVVTNKFNETRSSLENLLNNSPVPKAPEVSKRFEKFDIVDEVPDPRTPKSQKKDSDMNERLSRLSKPDDEA